DGTGSAGGTDAGSDQGSTGGETGSGTDQAGDLFSGLAKLVGVIQLDGLSGVDASLLSRSAGRAAGRRAGRSLAAVAADALTQDAFVGAYVYGEDGELVDTGKRGTLSKDPDTGEVTYEIEGLKDGVDYVVRYMKVVDSDKLLEFKAPAPVPEGETEVQAPVSPKTTVVAEAITNAILTATAGTGIDEEVVHNIIDAVKETIENLVDQGVIQIPSMVVETDPDVVETVKTVAAGGGDTGGSSSGETVDTTVFREVKNENAEEVSGLILSNEQVDTTISVLKTETQARTLETLAAGSTDDDKRAFIRKVFAEMVGDGDVPEFMIQFFADKYTENFTMTVKDLLLATTAGIQWKNGMPDTSGLTVSGLVSDVATFLGQVYEAYDAKQAGSATDEQLKLLGDLPPVFLAIFRPSDRDRWTSLTGDSTVSVPEGIALVVYITDHWLPDQLGLQATYQTTAGEDGGVTAHQEEPFDFDPMAPGSLLDLMGFFEVWQNYDIGYEIHEMWIHPGRFWMEDPDNPGMGQEIDMLIAGACVSNLGQVVQMMTGGGDPASGPMPPMKPTAPEVQVTLTYPKSDGTTGSIALVPEQGGDAWGWCFYVDPWRELWEGQDPGVIGPGDPPPQPDPERIISDFVSGDYTVTVLDADGTEVAKKVFSRKVITGMQDAYPVITSPNGMPNPLPEGASQAEMEENQQAWDEYWATGPTRFPADTDTDGDGVNDAAMVTVKWEAPDVTLPEGVKMGYHLSVGRSMCATQVDADDDGFSNYEEQQMGTDPWNPDSVPQAHLEDTDGDGWADAAEQMAGTDPNDGQSAPSDGFCPWWDWDPIYDTWQKNKILFVRAFTIPRPLPKQPLGDLDAYQLDVQVVFLDSETGEELGQGGRAHAEFYVADPIDPNATFAIEGTALVPDDGNTYRVALVKEQNTYNPDALFEWDRYVYTRTVIDVADPDATTGDYHLEATIADFLDAPQDAWF
ncbi:MAG: hypothetical protein D6708_10605, partial [Candidatus Dadabacteria bacterium]